MTEGRRRTDMNGGLSLRFQQGVILILMLSLLILITFYGYLPESYDYTIGSVATTDIYAPRSFVDSYETESKAQAARSQVKPVFVRSKDISDNNEKAVKDFFDITDQYRALIKPQSETDPAVTANSIVNDLKAELTEKTGNEIDIEDLKFFLELTNSSFQFIRDKGITITESIMREDANESLLGNLINQNINKFKEINPSYHEAADELNKILTTILEPNSTYDKEASKELADNTYFDSLNNPVTIERGTKIVSRNDVIDEHIYSNLVDLQLISTTSFAGKIFVRVALYVAVLFAALVYFLKNSDCKLKNDLRLFYMIIVTFIIPVVSAVYVSGISPLLTAEIFLAVICATFLGASYGIIITLFNMLIILPIYSFDLETLIVTSVGVLIASSIAGKSEKAYNSAFLRIIPTIVTVLASVCYNIFYNSSQTEFITSVAITAMSTLLQLVAAVGLMPIYELFSDTVTPVKLIHLSQPGQPLLKKLFIEASGTYQHSMMVANLSDAAAEAIHADALLCKVSAYYHDIGKLKNPIYFTENQTDGYNPHDDLTVMDSVRIITSHPKDGIALAKKSKLPNAIIKVIDEHHGTTYPAYFYNKACEEARQAGLEKPDVEIFRYGGHIPSSRESAIVMLADTCEAAIRSYKDINLEKAEELIRTLIKKKIDQDQLINSGLSFDDIEKIIIAFKQIYAGVFHERIQYPDENQNK